MGGPGAGAVRVKRDLDDWLDILFWLVVPAGWFVVFVMVVVYR